MHFLLEILINAAIVGLVIAWLERSAFPGWPEAIGSAFGIGLCAALAGMALPESLWVLSYAAGALGGGFVIAWLCELPLNRGFLAAGIYLVVRVAFAFLLGLVS